MPTLQQLRYLVALEDHRHFRRAAEMVNVTQPTLSGQLKELELRLGTPLIDRRRAPVVLTPAGREISARARRMLSGVDEIWAIARAAANPMGGTLRLGIVHSLGSYLMPLVVPELQKRAPDLRLYIREGLPDALFDQLDNGALDLLFYPLPVERRGLTVEPLFEEPLLLVAPRDHPLASGGTVQPQALAGETILTLEPGHRLFEQVRTLAQGFGAAISHDFEGTSLDTLRQMVAMKLGISLMPALYVRSEVARETLVTAQPFAGRAAPSRTIASVWREGAVRAESFGRVNGVIRETLRRDVPEVTVLDSD
jgi:LysR family hydrogen peroxide-inducible transcriptional activator